MADVSRPYITGLSGNGKENLGVLIAGSYNPAPDMFQNFLSKLIRCEVEFEHIGLLATVGLPIRKSLIKLDRQLFARAELQVQLAEVR